MKILNRQNNDVVRTKPCFVGDKDGGLWARGCGKAKDLRVQGGTKDAGKKTDN